MPYPSYPQPPQWPYKPPGYTLYPRPGALPRWEGTYAGIESVTPWMKLLVWALGLPYAASVQVPAIFAEQIAKSFRGQGFRARIGAGLSEQSREVSVWLDKEDR